MNRTGELVQFVCPALFGSGLPPAGLAPSSIKITFRIPLQQLVGPSVHRMFHQTPCIRPFARSGLIDPIFEIQPAQLHFDSVSHPSDPVNSWLQNLDLMKFINVSRNFHIAVYTMIIKVDCCMLAARSKNHSKHSPLCSLQEMLVVSG